MQILRSRVFKISVFAGTIVFLSQINKAQAQKTAEQEELYAKFESAMRAGYEERFDDAIRLSEEVRKQYPDEPAGAFGLLTTYDTIQRNYRVKLYDDKIDTLLQLSIDLAEAAYERDKKNGRTYFYLGIAYGFHSMLCAQDGKWMEAFKSGSRVLHNFNRAVAYSPEFYDAYYGLGLYKYWLGAKGAMRYLPFSGDNRKDGIRNMMITAKKGRYLDVSARYGLMNVFHNEKQYEHALNMADSLYKEYSQNPTLNYRRARILQDLGRWQEALRTFEHLEGILETAEHKSLSYKVECFYQQALCNYELSNYLEAQRLCHDALTLEPHVDFSKETNGPLESYEQILDSLHDLNNKVKSLVITEAAQTK